MSEQRTYTEKDLQEIIERQQLIAAIEHAIQMGKLNGDSPQFINPLVKLYNLLITPPNPAQGQTEQPNPDE